MMKKINICLFLFTCGCCHTMAQDIYKVESFTGTDLNGTSRYVGMGGAMNALGADISTMGNNPAGIGLFRKSDVSMTGSLQIQPNGIDFSEIGKTRASFDQMGFVYAVPFHQAGLEYFNFGFNYHKRRNFKNSFAAMGVGTNGLSQSLQMLDLAYVGNDWLDLSNPDDRELTTPLTNLGYDTQMIFPVYDKDGHLTGYEPSSAKCYDYQRAQWGGIQQYDFNISMNWNHQVYAGITLGVQDVNFNSAIYYAEHLLDETGGTHLYYTHQKEVITGNGFDIKLGVILRPIEESPFRIGFSVHTPTWFDLTQDSYLYMNSPYASKDHDYSEQDVRIGDNAFKIRTPWKFNLSLGTTVGNYLALDAEYEYADYSSSAISYHSYSYYWGGDVKDIALNDECKTHLNGVSTFKVGAEARILPNTYLRLGYNFISAPIKKDAFLNLFTASDSYYYNTNTDYVNLGETNRVTAGLGWKGKHFYIDAAYQYQKQEGDLYTFHVPEMNSQINRLKPQNIDFSKHSALLTLGYKF